MKTRFLFGWLLLALFLSACQPKVVNQAVEPGAGSPAGKASPAQTGDYQYIFAPPAAGAAAQVALDESRAVEALVPTTGGELLASGADGTQYRLEIPADALLVETTIRLVPAAVSGLLFGGEQTYAAQLEPEGLFFNNYATLTITPPQEIPLAEQLFFGYQAAGEDVVFAPPVTDSGEIKIRLLHFSGYGVTKGLLADPESVRERLGGDAERRLQSLAAEYLGRERQRQLLGGGDDENSSLGDVLSGLFEQFEKEVVQVRVAAAGESCAAGRLALQTVLGLERQKQLLGMSDDSGLAKYADLMDTVARVCLKEEYELCAEDHIIHRMIPVWLGFERQYQLLGMGGSAVLEEAKALTRKCLTFELVFESQVNLDSGYGGGFDSSVRAKIPIRFNPDELAMKGSSVLVNESFTYKEPGCSVDSVRGGSTIQVASLAYVADTHSASDALGYVRDFKLNYFPERTNEVFTVTCPDSPSYTSQPSPLWWGGYLVLHAEEITQGDSAEPAAPPPMPDMAQMMAAAEAGVEMPAFSIPAVSPGGGFVLEGWEVTGGSYYAKKEWIKTDGELGLLEAGTFKLYHRPGQ